MGWPSNRMRPEVGLRNPEMMWTSVVFPEPLGPISPVIFPSSAVSETLFSAMSPPKWRETRSTSSSMAFSGRMGFGLARQAVVPLAFRHQPARQVQDDQNDQYADQHHPQRSDRGGIFGRDLDEACGVVDQFHDQRAHQGA